MTVTLRAPDGSTPLSAASEQPAGTYPVPFRTVAEAGATDATTPADAGTWTFEVKAVDDLGQASSMTRTFVVDDTLGFLRVPALRAVPPRRPGDPGHVEAVTAARGSASPWWTTAGRVVRRGLAQPAAREAGDQRATWDGLGQNGKRLEGRFVVQVVATSALGRSELDAPIVIRKAAAPRG